MPTGGGKSLCYQIPALVRQEAGHGVTVVVECTIDPPVREPENPLEITEARLFAEADLPATLAMGMRDMLDAALDRRAVVLE